MAFFHIIGKQTINGRWPGDPPVPGTQTLVLVLEAGSDPQVALQPDQLVQQLQVASVNVPADKKSVRHQQIYFKLKGLI